jgi:hypothetical protein
MHLSVRSCLPVARSAALLLFAACATSGDDAASGDSATVAPPAAGATAPSAAQTAAALQIDSLIMTVYKTPTCGCCRAWVDHVRANGFRATTTDLADVAPVKNTHKVPANLVSCHTALIGGYVVEGHVPADDIKRLLAERPDIIGIAAPGMPSGSPGMENGQIDRYDVIAIGKDGSRKVWATHGQ